MYILFKKKKTTYEIIKTSRGNDYIKYYNYIK